MIAELAVEGDVGVAQQQIVRADPGRKSLMRAAVDGAILTKHVVITDFKISRFPDVLQILGFPTNGGEGKKLVGFSEDRVPLQDDVGVQDAVVTQRDLRPDHAERADADIPSDVGVG
jgi:hypothetical protein